jgi:hypothetical protein
MNAGKYRILQVLSASVILGAEMLLSYIFIWLIEGHGIIACGRGIFDDPTWYLDLNAPNRNTIKRDSWKWGVVSLVLIETLMSGATYHKWTNTIVCWPQFF